MLASRRLGPRCRELAPIFPAFPAAVARSPVAPRGPREPQAASVRRWPLVAVGKASWPRSNSGSPPHSAAAKHPGLTSAVPQGQQPPRSLVAVRCGQGRQASRDLGFRCCTSTSRPRRWSQSLGGRARGASEPHVSSVFAAATAAAAHVVRRCSLWARQASLT